MTNTLLQNLSTIWSHWILTGLLESAVMLLLVLLIWGVIHNRCSQGVGYVLFLLVMLKVLVPLPIGVPLPGFIGVSSGGNVVELSPESIHQEIKAGMEPVPPAQQHNVMTGSGQNAYNSENPVITPEYRLHSGFYSYLSDQIDDSTLSGESHEPIVYEPRIPERQPATPMPTAETTLEPVLSQKTNHSLFQLATSHSSLATMLAWLTIVLFLLTHFAITQWRFARLLRDRQFIDDSRFYPETPGLKRVPVYVCPHIATPAVYGFFQPVILFPEAMLQRLTDVQLRWVLLHELAHIRRRDLQTAFVQRLAVILHFYNPAVWIASLMMNHLRESACDDMALAADRSIPRKAIGDALLRIVEYSAVVPRGTNSRPGRGLLGAFHFTDSVRHRLTRLLDKKRILHTKTGAGSMTLLILTTVLLVPYWQALPTTAVPQDNPQIAKVVVENITEDVATPEKPA